MNFFMLTNPNHNIKHIFGTKDCVSDVAKHNSIRIVHITEALGGGVLYVLQLLITAQIQCGFDVILIHSFRRDTPSDEELDKLFPVNLKRIVLPMVTNISIKYDLYSYKEIVRLLNDLKPNAIHLHSSKAGALGRAAAWSLGMCSVTFYSPHGLSFLRQDVSLIKRFLFLLFEFFGGILGGTVIACSKSEGSIANKIVETSRVKVIENAILLDVILPVERITNETVRVVSSGRLCYQKAPWRFYNLAATLSNEKTCFIWIGGGDESLLSPNRLFKPLNNFKVTGWLDREIVLAEIQQADIFVMTSLWEGMPLALIEAQTAGLPVVVWDAVGSRDIVIDGVTGFICKNTEDFIKKVKILIMDKDLRSNMGQAGRAIALKRYDSKLMHHRMLEVYGV